MELRSGYKQTEIGLIPEDWDAVLLDSVSKRGSGHTPSKSFPEYWNGDIKWISLQDSDQLDQLYVHDTAVHITSAGIANSSACIHPSGTVVLSRDAGVGKSAVMADDMAVSQHFMAWTCDARLSNIFLYYWLQSAKAEFERIAIGNTIKTIGLGYFKELVVPYPPVGEQEAIAEALSDADALIESLAQLIAKKRLLKQGAMQDLLTGKKRLPGFEGKWKNTELRSEAMLITKGATPTSYKRGFTDRGVNFFKAESFSERGNLVMERMAYIDEETHRFLKRSQLADGDVLFSIAGALGRTTVVRKHWLPANTNQALALVRLRQDSRLNRDYLALFLTSDEIQQRLTSISVQAAQANLSLTDVGDFVIRHPEFEEQTAIATILSDMDAEIAALEAKLAKARQVKQGMMQQLLTGAIRLI